MTRISKYTAMQWVYRIAEFDRRINDLSLDEFNRAEARRQRQALVDGLHMHGWAHLLDGSTSPPRRSAARKR